MTMHRERVVPVPTAIGLSPDEFISRIQLLQACISLNNELAQMAVEKTLFKESAPDPKLLYAFLIAQLYRASGVITPKRNDKLFSYLFDESEVSAWKQFQSEITTIKRTANGTNFQVYKPECIDNDTDLFVNLINFLMTRQALSYTVVPFVESVYQPHAEEKELSNKHVLRDKFPWSQFFFLFLLNIHTSDRDIHHYLDYSSPHQVKIKVETFSQLLLILYSNFHESIPVFCKRTALLNSDISWLYRKFLELQSDPAELQAFCENLLKVPIVGVRIFDSETERDQSLSAISHEARTWKNVVVVASQQRSEHTTERQEIFPYEKIEQLLALYAVYLYNHQVNQLTAEQLGSIFTLAGGYLHEQVPESTPADYEAFKNTYFPKGITVDNLLVFLEAHPHFSAQSIQFLEVIAGV